MLSKHELILQKCCNHARSILVDTQQQILDLKQQEIELRTGVEKIVNRLKQFISIESPDKVIVQSIIIPDDYNEKEGLLRVIPQLDMAMKGMVNCILSFLYYYYCEMI